jgi:NAD(P)-dependent dehydrogenase (short-subunit alcohol dehydrogenase family)
LGRLTDKRALITGGTTGIGLAAAVRFSAEGARVAVTGTNPATLDAAAQRLGKEVMVIQSDAGQIADQRGLAGTIRNAFGGLDILVVNAGVAELRPLAKWDEEAFDRSWAINFKGPFFLIQSLLPLFASPASIVLNGSINAHIGMPNTSVYAATKAALISLTKTLSGELIPRGIRVNAISPGPIATPLYGKLGLAKDDLQSVSESLQNQVPAHRFGTADEIAQAMLFLASDEAPFTVGSELIIDGGLGNL